MKCDAKPGGLGKQAAELHWPQSGQGTTFDKVAIKLGVSYSAARGAARRYRKKHPELFGHVRNGEPSLERETGTEFRENGNYARATGKTERIKSLDDLIAVCKIDLDVWQILKWGVKKWEVGAKAEWKDLEWKDGKIDGWTKSDGIAVEPLWSVWADLIRINPIAIFPTIRPVTCEATFRAPPKPTGGTTLRSLILADPHWGFSRDMPSMQLVPFHSRPALDVALQLASSLQPDRIDILGDILDFVMLSDKFLRSPRFEYCTQPAINEAHWWLRQLREACPNTRMAIHEGNHDVRMKNSVITHLRAAYGLRPADELDLPASLSPERLLALHNLGIEWVGGYPNDEQWLGTKLRLSHGNKAQKPFATVQAIVNGSDTSHIVGHIHRREMASRTRFLSTGIETIRAYCPGCLCRIDGPVPGVSNRQQWQQGCAIVDYAPDGEAFSLYDIEIKDGRAIWDSHLFAHRDRLEDLRADMPDYRW